MTKKKTKDKKIEIVAVELGCGQTKQNTEFYEQNLNISPTKIIGVDMVKCKGVDVVHNLTKFPYPFADDSVDVIYTCHFLEHLDGEERMKFFNECYRILKIGGKMRHVHPYYKSVRAVQDPTQIGRAHV